MNKLLVVLANIADQRGHLSLANKIDTLLVLAAPLEDVPPSNVEDNDVITRDGYTLFWGGWPSNWEPTQFTIDGITYNCVEQWMMAQKAQTFGDQKTFAKIMASVYPKEQKMLGREVHGYSDEVWKQIRYKIVVKGNLAKFQQNPKLKQQLLATGNTIIVETSPEDTIWGIGLGIKSPDATQPDKWRGMNLLGRALMSVRQTLKNEQF